MSNENCDSCNSCFSCDFCQNQTPQDLPKDEVSERQVKPQRSQTAGKASEGKRHEIVSSQGTSGADNQSPQQVAPGKNDKNKDTPIGESNSTPAGKASEDVHEDESLSSGVDDFYDCENGSKIMKVKSKFPVRGYDDDSSLSDKRFMAITSQEPKGDVMEYVNKTKDVKEFVRRLKEEMKKMFVYDEVDCFEFAVEHEIDKLAGKELSQ